jgi:ribosomal protein S18 acetylase RimI-like enzyme
MTKILYSSLNHTEAQFIHGAFLSAFSDYFVPAYMPYDKFTAFLSANGFAPSLSAGAFVGGGLRAFILNGIRELDGELTAYNAGTGVLPEYRRQGLTKDMFAYCLPLLKAAGAKRYVLEVIQQNEPALALYKGLGFSVTRELICYSVNKDRLCAEETAARLADAGGICADVQRFWDYSPTWQNTFDSINAVPGQHAAAVIEYSSGFAGYGIINVNTGRVAQLAVRSDCRGRGLGSQLLCSLAQQAETECVSFLNVDGGCASMRGFATKHGFEENIRQYEMALDI